MSDSQQPGASGDDQVPPIPPAPSAGVPPVPPAAPEPAAAEAPAIPGSEQPAEPFAASEPVNPYAPPSTTVPSSAPAAPVPPVTPVAPEQPANPYAAPAANPYAAPSAPAAAQQPVNPYAATPANPYAAPGAGGPAAPGYAATPAYAAGAPVGPSRFNVLGLVSLILGGVAFLFGITIGWVPYVGFFFVLLALVGVVLGIVGLLAKNKGKGLAIAGTIVSGVSLLLTAAISIIMLLFVTSFSNTVEEWPDDPVITDPDYTAEDEDPNALGGVDNPAAVGDTVTFSDYDGVEQWDVVVGAPNLDATADVLAAYEYNEQPAAGNVYIVVPMTVTYLGEDTDLPYMLFTDLLTNQANDVYDISYAQYPGSIYDAGELAAGESAEVNLVFEVPADEVAGSLLRINSIWGNDIYVQLG